MLNTIVVGSGIAGLVTAIALRRDGHRVTVIEQFPEPRDIGGGIQLAPNATRVLREIRAMEYVTPEAVRPLTRTLRRWNDGSVIHELELGDSVERGYGDPYLVIRRADLLEGLMNAALASDGDGAISFELDTRVSGYRQQGDQAEVHAADGRVWRGDVVIAADGLHSVARAHLGETDAPTYSGDSAWRGAVPAELLTGEIRALAGLDTPGTNVWVGPQCHLVHYPVRNGRLVTFGIVIAAEAAGIESYDADGDPEALFEALKDWDPRVLELVRKAPELKLLPLMVRQPLSRWTDGRIALVGDACHPMLPHQAQGSAQAMESGFVVAQSLRGLSVQDDVAAALARYETLRRPRATAVQTASAQNGRVYHLADGAEQERRDEEIRARGGNASLEWNWLWGASPTDGAPVLV